jgi:hypothetical protein
MRRLSQAKNRASLRSRIVDAEQVVSFRLASFALESFKNKKGPCLKQGPFASPMVADFIPVTGNSALQAAASTYSSGRSSNSLRHSSEQKKYFLPANWVWNSGFVSSTLMPQTGSVVMASPRFFEIVPLRWEVAKTFPFEPRCKSLSAFALAADLNSFPAIPPKTFWKILLAACSLYLLCRSVQALFQSSFTQV